MSDIDYKAQCDDLIRGSQAREFELKKITAERAKLQEKLDLSERRRKAAEESEGKAHARLKLADRYIDVVDNFLKDLLAQTGEIALSLKGRSSEVAGVRRWLKAKNEAIDKLVITEGKTALLEALKEKA